MDMNCFLLHLVRRSEGGVLEPLPACGADSVLYVWQIDIVRRNNRADVRSKRRSSCTYVYRI